MPPVAIGIMKIVESCTDFVFINGYLKSIDVLLCTRRHITTAAKLLLDMTDSMCCQKQFCGLVRLFK